MTMLQQASAGERFLAFAIDSILVTFAASVIKTIVSAADGWSRGIWFGVSIGTRDWWVLLLFVAYFSWFAMRRSGRTIGKQAVSIEVRAYDNQPLSDHHLLVREVIKAILLPIAWVSFLLVVLTEDNRALHDYLMESKVVRGISQPEETMSEPSDDVYYD